MRRPAIASTALALTTITGHGPRQYAILARLPERKISAVAFDQTVNNSGMLELAMKYLKNIND